MLMYESMMDYNINYENINGYKKVRLILWVLEIGIIFLKISDENNYGIKRRRHNLRA